MFRFSKNAKISLFTLSILLYSRKWVTYKSEENIAVILENVTGYMVQAESHQLVRLGSVSLQWTFYG